MTPPQHHVFKLSGLRIESDGASGNYLLGPSSSFRQIDGHAPAAQTDALPVDTFAGYTSFPAEAPGWTVAIGRTSSRSIRAAAAATSRPLAHRPSADPQASEWESVDHCLLDGGIWAVELRATQQWLRVDDGSRATLYFRMVRPRT